jgi:hypothetical protein
MIAEEETTSIHITKTPTHYQNTHTLPKHPHITKTPTHYQNLHTHTHTLQNNIKQPKYNKTNTVQDIPK